MGPTGATGTSGTAGAKGATGATGTNGSNGTNGAVGATGATGATGSQGDVGPVAVGSAPNQVPAFTHLGGNASEDYNSVVLVHLHTRDAQPYEVWRERVSDTETLLKFKGSDGVIRSRTETWT